MNKLLNLLPLSFFFLLLLLIGCDQGQSDLVILTGKTMGTTFTVKIVEGHGSIKQVDKQQIQAEIQSLLAEVNRQMSTYLSNSEISLFNRFNSTQWFPISRDFALVIEQSLKISDVSNGAFDVTIGPLVNLWGFGPEKRETLIPNEKEIVRRKSLTGYYNISVRLEPPAIKKKKLGVSCDLSAIAKGFGVDKIALYLEQIGIQHYMVEIGGEVRTKGSNHFHEEWRIGLQSPGGNSIKRVVRLSNTSMATSGDYANYHELDGVRYSHTIDPRTGEPIRHKLASVTVIHPSCMKADALATAINVLGPEAGYNFALKHGLSILMVLREEDYFVEKMSPEFSDYILKQF